jgi:hypothetical protein
MFYMVKNIYRMKTKGMELFTATEKPGEFFFWQLEMFDVCTTGVCRHRYSAVNRQTLDFCLHRHPVWVECLYHARIVLSVGGSFAYYARNARCTATTDFFFFFFFFFVGAEIGHCTPDALRPIGLLYTAWFSSPRHLQRHSTSNDVRDLC